jgi:chromosome segregation ATPase
VNREPASKKDLELTRVELGEKIDEVKADVALLKVDVTVLKEDVKILKVDVAELKVDVTGLKQDVAELKEDVTGLKKDMKEVRTDIAILTVQTSQNTADLHEFKELNRRQMDTVITAIDGLAKMITDDRVERAATEHALRRHDHQLDDHEKRIKILEKKTA